MIDMLLEKMKSIDYIYTRVYHSYKNDHYVNVSLKEGNWSILDGTDTLLITREAEEILNYIKENKYNQLSLLRDINTALLNVIVLAKMNIKNAMVFFTDRDVEEYEKELESFNNGLVQTISKILSRSKLSLVDGE